MRLVARAWRMTKQEGRWADYKEATSSLEPAVLTINPGRIYLATDQSTLGVFHRKGPENPPHTQRLEPFPRCAGIGCGVRVPLLLRPRASPPFGAGTSPPLSTRVETVDALEFLPSVYAARSLKRVRTIMFGSAVVVDPCGTNHVDDKHTRIAPSELQPRHNRILANEQP